MGRKGGQLGGKRRLITMTPEQRIATMIVGVSRTRYNSLFVGWLIFVTGSLIWLTGHTPCQEEEHSEYSQAFQHGENVSPSEPVMQSENRER